MDDVAKVLVKLVGYGEKASEEFVVSCVNIDGRNICKYENNSEKKRDVEWNLVYVLVICLGRIGIDVCFRVDILRIYI